MRGIWYSWYMGRSALLNWKLGGLVFLLQTTPCEQCSCMYWNTLRQSSLQSLISELVHSCTQQKLNFFCLWFVRALLPICNSLLSTQASSQFCQLNVMGLVYYPYLHRSFQKNEATYRKLLCHFRRIGKTLCTFLYSSVVSFLHIFCTRMISTSHVLRIAFQQIQLSSIRMTLLHHASNLREALEFHFRNRTSTNTSSCLLMGTELAEVRR